MVKNIGSFSSIVLHAIKSSLQYFVCFLTQGCGLFTKEEEVFNEKGSLLTRGPLTYRIPRCTDIPGQLNVHLLKDCPNETPVYSSKVSSFTFFKKKKKEISLLSLVQL